MIKRFTVSYDYKNNTLLTMKEKGDPEINFEDEIKMIMEALNIKDDNIISVTTTNGIVYEFFYKG